MRSVFTSNRVDQYGQLAACCSRGTAGSKRFRRRTSPRNLGRQHGLYDQSLTSTRSTHRHTIAKMAYHSPAPTGAEHRAVDFVAGI